MYFLRHKSLFYSSSYVSIKTGVHIILHFVNKAKDIVMNQHGHELVTRKRNTI